eukprot:gene43484-10588_t
MPPAWRPPKAHGPGTGVGRPLAGRAAARRLSDIISDDGFGDEAAVRWDEGFGPVPSVGSGGQPRARSLGPPVRQQLYAPVDFAGLHQAVSGAFAHNPSAGYAPAPTSSGFAAP